MKKNQLLKNCWVDTDKRKPVLKQGFALVVYNKKSNKIHVVNDMSVFLNENIIKWMLLPVPE